MNQALSEQTGGKSLGATIPSAIKDHFGLKEKDKLIWKIEMDNDFIIVVKPVKKEEE